MEIWNDREYILWCGICGWETVVAGVDVRTQEERPCPDCGSGDHGIRERGGKEIKGRGVVIFHTEYVDGDLKDTLGMRGESE